PPASARNHHPDGSQADDALTINLDQSVEAAQRIADDILHRKDGPYQPVLLGARHDRSNSSSVV
ncbi:hypothetical protein, partial [Ruegeria sp. HKCCA4008]|uniref:hypothetical protein n=1 Tax=Ruegeria sp. HKCCA4008 TaxID=2682999 RepID=UPI001C2BDA42